MSEKKKHLKLVQPEKPARKEIKPEVTLRVLHVLAPNRTSMVIAPMIKKPKSD